LSAPLQLLALPCLATPGQFLCHNFTCFGFCWDRQRQAPSFLQTEAKPIDFEISLFQPNDDLFAGRDDKVAVFSNGNSEIELFMENLQKNIFLFSKVHHVSRKLKHDCSVRGMQI